MRSIHKIIILIVLSFVFILMTGCYKEMDTIVTNAATTNTVPTDTTPTETAKLDYVPTDIMIGKTKQ